MFTEHLRRLRAYQSVAQARAGIAAYFHFYNHVRPHQALGYRTPRQVFVQAMPFGDAARGKIGLERSKR